MPRKHSLHLWCCGFTFWSKKPLIYSTFFIDCGLSFCFGSVLLKRMKTCLSTCLFWTFLPSFFFRDFYPLNSIKIYYVDTFKNEYIFIFNFFIFEKAVTPCYKGFLFHDIRFYEGLTIIVIAVKWNWFKMFILFHKGMNNWWIYLMMNWRISFAFSDANIWLFTTKID